MPLDHDTITRQLTRHIEMQSALCDALEKIADGLPETTNAQRLLHLARTIHPTIHSAHRFEEQVLFPALEQAEADTEALSETLNRLHFEHLEDEGFAQELYDEMIGFATGQVARDAERLGYMLRGFFEGLRRHLAFEKEHLIPMLKHERAH
ncbi:hemerythrin domain-containing protein [Pontivivens insulae]|uniref:Hemerythrin-like domain-containing protein n=1 Tax=Pontivivens insulae TaxID=1639689 RepID=A0A2R8AFH0_9RHOB|nr:hemerythrin domain-containing protein [Pontivivens insulae]RED12226.1 hemerythrin HHE cation binding domain-containing protein [Pontivivens insulae]SPF30982.1 hypothetical protein POI8812_03329 [Pontivivens insulae]